jgi:solute:Na+ symporter, SSS family
MGFTLIDGIVIILYLVAVAFFGIWSAGTQKSTTDYFLGGREMPWWAILFSVVATETSTLTFISIPAVAYGSNLTFLQLTFGYIIGRIIVAIWFLPAYVQGELSTAYEYLENRFGHGMRKAASSTFIITRLLADGVRLFATAIPLAIIFRFAGVFDEWSDTEVYLMAISVIAIITLIYTFLGGIKAVIWMDVVQMVVYIGGALFALALSVRKTGCNRNAGLCFTERCR